MFGGRESLFVLALCLAAAPVRAQTAPVVTIDDHRSIVEVTPGVSLQAPADVNQRPTCENLALPCSSPRTFGDLGLALAAAVYPSVTVGIVGELSVYANHWLTYGSNCVSAGGRVPQTCPVDATNHVRSALAGFKVRTRFYRNASLHGSTHARLFAQILAGPQWSDVGPPRRVLQPGVGVDDYLSSGIAVHVECAYRFAPDDRRDLSTSRFLVGIGIPIGAR